MIFVKIVNGKNRIDVHVLDTKFVNVYKRKGSDDPEFDKYVKKNGYRQDPSKITAYIQHGHGDFDFFVIPSSTLKFEIHIDGVLAIDSDSM